MQAVNLLPADARLAKKGFTSVGSDLPGKKTMQIGGGIAAGLLFFWPASTCTSVPS